MHYEWHHPELGNTVVRLPPASIFIMGRPQFGLNFLQGNLVRTVFKKPVVQREYNILGVKTRWDFFLRGYLMANAVMSFSELCLMEAVNGDPRHYTKT